MFDNLSVSDATVEKLINVGISLIILIVGYIVIKIVLHVAKKTLERSSLNNEDYHVDHFAFDDHGAVWF